MLYDPQTSGGLLLAIGPDEADSAVEALSRAGVTAHPVGGVEALKPGSPEVRREAQENRPASQAVAVRLR
jgi:selenide,water dikinase